MTDRKDRGSAPPELGFDRPEQGTLLIRLTGEWTVENRRPSPEDVRKELASGPPVTSIRFDTGDVSHWDSGLLAFVTRVMDLCSRDGMAVDSKGLPEGVQKLLALAAVVPQKKGVGRESGKDSFLSTVGAETTDFFRSTGEILAFVGEVFVAFGRFLRGKARFRGSDLTLVMQECGLQALPIVSLISLLVGLILAFVGAVQLMMFGAQIYVASLVGIAMVRVMGAIMTGIIMAGRTGAAFAAQLGTMEVNEEIDAFRTMGISPMEFLVLPRMLGLALMMPLLCLYADLMGILGGLIVGVGMLDLNVVEYFNQTRASVSLFDLFIGIFQG
ncbi:MAG TPA: ABC transporter permease, partial [Deltaproteobacteria bacterium]|nr:ABC transporter permease [Deltaproteobacteria bacterium]